MTDTTTPAGMTTPQTLRDLAAKATPDAMPVEGDDTAALLDVPIVALKAATLTGLLDRLESAERVRAAAREVVEQAIDDNETLSIRLSNLIAALDHAISQPHSAEPDTKFRAVGLDPRYIEAHPGLREAPIRDRSSSPTAPRVAGMSEPTTAAGRALLALLETEAIMDIGGVAARLAEVEAEAAEMADPKGIGRAITEHGGKAVETIRAEALTAAAGRIEALPQFLTMHDEAPEASLIGRDAVLAALSAEGGPR